MGIRIYRPTTAGRRGMTASDFEELAGPDQPVKNLCLAKRRTSGRNNQGRITVRHRGGGHKRKLRLVDFRRQKRDVLALVKAIQYDPSRSAHVALLHYIDGDKAYILWPVGLNVGDRVVASEQADIKPGNHLPLRNIPLGTPIHNLEIRLGRGGQLIRAGGSAGQVLAKEGGYAQVRLPSGEVRKVHGDCWATVGQVGNVENENITIGKAGRNRWLGWRPTVRGVAQNPVDHPHGGGEGRAGQGNPHPVSPWGWHTKGHKTRRNPRTDKWIVRRRK